jgi:hypothetical protein
MKCPGSVAAQAGFPDTTSIYAEEGIRAHEVFELCLRLDCAPEDISKPADPEDVVAAVGHALDFLRGYLAVNPTADYHPEQILMADETHDIWGTSDLIVVNTDELVVLDYKHGYGVVEVEDNAQLLTYAVGARRKYGRRRRYRLVIVQPRARHDAGPVRETMITDGELTKFATLLKAAAKATGAPNAPRTAGTHCRWCRARGECPALAEFALQAAIKDYTTEEPLPEPAEPAVLPMDNARLAELLRVAPVVELWLTGLRETVKDRVSMGQAVPGFKMVAGRRMRYWSAEDTAIINALLQFGLTEDEATPRSLISVAVAEKTLKQAHKQGRAVAASTALAPIVAYKESAPTVAPESDPRPAVSFGSEFSEITPTQEVSK